jgi:pyruvate dehydrogenase E1 component alpha subunit
MRANQDWMAPYYRSIASVLTFGMSPEDIVSAHLAKGDDVSSGGRQMPGHYGAARYNIVSLSSPVGTQVLHAVGIAMGAWVRGEDVVALSSFGEGTSNQGEIHEAMNFAGVHKLPVIFVCENNLYMEYTPISDVTAVEHPAADRASAYGLERIIVDGNDADAVYRAAISAYDKARAGGGPSLIECMTYRHSGHSRADPAKYRPDGELEKWKERDPIKLYRARLKQFGIADDVIAGIDADVMRRVNEATEACKAAPPPPLDLLTTDVYADGGFAWRN